MTTRTRIAWLILILIPIVVVLFEPTPYLVEKCRFRSRALWQSSFPIKSWRWKCLDDMRELKQRGEFFAAADIFAEAFAKMPEKSRLEQPELVTGLLSITIEILRSLPENAVIITKSDNETYPLWFAQHVQDIRSDVIAIDRRFWQMPKYRKFLWRNSDLRLMMPRDSLMAFADNTADDDSTAGLVFLAHRLARTRDVFVVGESAPEFPQESLYFMPMMGMLYSAIPIPDSACALTAYNMLYGQNWNYLCENPPIASKQEFYNSRGCELMPVVFNSAMLMHKCAMDSLADILLRKFDTWLMWNPYYIASRPLLAYQMGDEYQPWLDKLQSRFNDSAGKWYAEVLKKYLDYYRDKAPWLMADIAKPAAKAPPAKRAVKPTRRR